MTSSSFDPYRWRDRFYAYFFQKILIIFSDSKSVLEAMTNRKFDNPTVLCLVKFYNELQSLGKDIILCWIPSHIGTPGNEKTDKAAKQALNKQISELYSFYRQNN